MRTIQKIYEDLRDSFAERSGITVIEGGDMSLRLWAVASEIYTLEVQSDFVSRQCFPQTALGNYLDMHAQMRGLQRGTAEKAGGILRFYLEEARPAAVEVPAGVVCMSEAETEFITTDAGEIPAGETYCDVPAEAMVAGAGGNLPAGGIRYIELPPTGVSGVTNPAAFSGGCGAEDDETLRERILASYRKLPNGANKAYYEEKVMSRSGVAAVTVLPKNRGIGTVDICFATESGVPDAAEVDAVQTMLDGEREICVDLEVFAPETVNVNVTAELEIGEGYDAQTVLQAAEDAICGCFGGKMLGKAIYRARLGAALMSVEGVENYSLLAPAADQPITETQLPVPGVLSISEAV